MPVSPELVQRLRKAVKAAIRPAGRGPLFWTNWRGSGDGTDAASCVALVQYARAVECVPDGELQTALARLSECDWEASAGTLLGHDPEHVMSEDAAEQARFAAVARGLVACVRGAIAWVGKEEATACRHVGEAAACYDEAWPLTREAVLRNNVLEASRDASYALLHAALQQNAFPHGITTSTWLVLQRLLAVLFEKDFPEPDFQHEVSLLLFVEDSLSGGHVEQMQLEALTVAGLHPGLLLDPLAFGLTLLDDAMLTSLRLAWRLARQSVKATPEAKLRPLRIVPNLPWWLSVLGGGSAGGLFAASLYATALGQPLDVRRSATVAVKLMTGVSNDEDVDLAVDQVELVPVGGVVAKLREAGLHEKRLDAVALHTDNFQEAEELFTRPKPVAVASLAELVEFLRGEAIHEETLARHALEVAGEWEKTRTALQNHPGREFEDAQDEHRLDCYVSPTYHIEEPRPGRAAGVGEGRDTVDVPVPGDGNAALRFLLAKIAPGQGLVVYDKAGAGKTVFSLRLRYVAASAERESRSLFGDRAPLVVRREGSWPTDWSIRHLLDQDKLLRERCPDKEDRSKVIDYALKNDRVVLILDAWDQFSPEERDHVALLFRGSARGGDADADHVRWVVTGRVQAIEERLRSGDHLFEHRHWTWLRIDPFTWNQQDAYFADVTTRNWREMIPDPVPEEMEALLGLPLVLRMLRRILEATPADEPLPQFRSLAELFVRVARMLLDRAVTKGQEELKAVGLVVDAATRPLLERVLSMIAFQMLLEKKWNGEVQGRGDGQTGPVTEFLAAAKKRFVRLLDERLRDRDLDASDRQEAEDELRGQRAKWDRAVKILRTIELNHRAVQERMDVDGIAFRNRKTAECYAALYLARYATEWDRVGTDDIHALDDPCAWSCNGHPEWSACWRLLLDMPIEERVAGVWDQAVAVLFRPTKRPEKYETLPTKGPQLQLRPTELMFRAWQILKREKSPHLAPILTAYRQEFRDVLTGADLEQARTAGEMVPEFELSRLVQDGVLPQERYDLILGPTADGQPRPPAFVRCPPQGDVLEFWMGSADGDRHAGNSEKRRHRVRLTPFWMAACAVTRAQYRLFDPHLEQKYEYDFLIISPDEDCPAIDVNWYDGFCFTLWLGEGSALATEAEWEGSARGGRDPVMLSASRINMWLRSLTREDRDLLGDPIGIPPYDATFTTDQVNFNGRHPLTGKKSRFLGRTLPVRWDKDRRKKAEDEQSPTAKVPAYEPNAYGIWQAHGNVWEWCLSEYEEDLYRRRATEGIVEVPPEAAEDMASSTERVLRGGSYFARAVQCRTATRFHLAPVSRFGFVGLRSCWGRVASSSASSSS